MDRRDFLTAVSGAVSAPAGPRIAAAEDVLLGAPRKVIVGTVVQAFWVEYPGVQRRLEQLAAIVDRMAEQSVRKFGRSLDLAVLPEVAVCGEAGQDVMDRALPFPGPVSEVFSRNARDHRCYIVVPMYLLEDRAKRLCFNAGVLVGRKGELVGIYRKLHPAVPAGSDSMEGGITPGKQAPVFDCDFGKLGIQICFDMEFEYGWRELARQGAELVAWPTQSPQTTHPAARAMQNRLYIVSSTWRNNASIFEPTGKIAAQVREQGQVLVEELDLSYVILPWSSKLQNGAALRKAYGNKVGYRYYEDEDCGLFWSNDAQLPIREMIRALGLAGQQQEWQRIRSLFRKAGVPSY